MSRILVLIILVFGVGMVACSPQSTSAVQEVSRIPATSVVIYITPTPAPTTIPTLELLTPSPTPTMTPTPTATVDVQAQQVACEASLNQLYVSASEACLGKPNEFFCNGGLPPRVEPAGAIANSLALVGALVEADIVTSVNPPAITDGGGGVVYLHLREGVVLNALLVGDTVMRDVTPPNMGFSNWKSFTVTTTQHATNCSAIPPSAFIVQGLYGQATNFVLNSVSVDLNGTLMVQTNGTISHFVALEGIVRLTIAGSPRSLYPGQQVDVTYSDTSYSTPLTATEAQPLTWELIAHLPTLMMDRPVLLPQPGYAETTGNVNMRTAPNQDSTLMYQVPAGQIVSILGANPAGDWLHIRLGNGETGWMRADLLQRSSGVVTALYEQTPIPPQRAGTLGSKGLVIAQQGGNLRQAPDVFFTTLTTLPAGTEVEIVSRSPYSPFVKVRGNGFEGWLALITLETQSVIASLPIDYTVPLPPQPTATPIFQFGGGHAYPNPNAGGN